MPKFKTALKNVLVTYDSKDGAIRLTSQDPRLAGKPFQLTVTADSGSYRSLHELVDSSDSQAFGREILESARVQEGSLYSHTGDDPRRFLSLGLDRKGEPFVLDLKMTPHWLIGGEIGGGSPSVMGTVGDHAASQEDAKLYAVDLTKVELARWTKGPNAKLATTPFEAVRMLMGIVDAIDSRLKLMETYGANNLEDLESKTGSKLPTGFVLLEKFHSSFAKSSADRALLDAAVVALQDILRKGRIAGFHVFLHEINSAENELVRPLLENLNGRMVVGRVQEETAKRFFKTPQRYGSAVIDRGVVQVEENGVSRGLFTSFYRVDRILDRVINLSALRTDDSSSFRLLNEDPRNGLRIGRKADNSEALLKLESAPNWSIFGLPGSGKTNLLRNVQLYGVSQSSIEVTAIDLKTVEFEGIAYRNVDTYAKTYDEALVALDRLRVELNRRRELMKIEKVNDFKELKGDLPALFLVIDELEPLVSSVSKKYADYTGRVEDLMNTGAAAGLKIFIGTQSPEFSKTSLGEQFTSRIIMGGVSEDHYAAVFGEPAGFGEALLVTGIGIMKTALEEQTLFGSFYLSEV